MLRRQDARARGERRGDRLRRRAHARLPRLGHARHRRQPPCPTTSPNAPLEEAVGAARGLDPGRAAAGDRHLRRRSIVLPASRPHPRARDLASGVRRRRAIPTPSPTRVSRGSRRSSTTRASRVAACRPCTTSSSAAARRARTRGGSSATSPISDDRFTTFVDVGDWLHRRREALLAHRTQVDPEGHWMRLPDDAVREVFPWDEYCPGSIEDRPHATGRRRGRPLRRAARRPRHDRRRTSGLKHNRAVSSRVDEQGEHVAKYLTQEWLDQSRELAKDQPERPGAIGEDAVRRHRRSRRRHQVLLGARGRQAAREPARRDRRPRLHHDLDLRGLGRDRQGRARCQRRVHAGKDEGRRATRGSS